MLTESTNHVFKLPSDAEEQTYNAETIHMESPSALHVREGTEPPQLSEEQKEREIDSP
jgi:hypothetical protein